MQLTGWANHQSQRQSFALPLSVRANSLEKTAISTAAEERDAVALFAVLARLFAFFQSVSSSKNFEDFLAGVNIAFSVSALQLVCKFLICTGKYNECQIGSCGLMFSRKSTVP